MVDDDEDSRSIDGRSFGSFESGPEPGSTAASSMKDSSANSRAKSRSPSRPATISPHPSLIGYLTTSSPVVQATHIEPRAQPLSPTKSADLQTLTQTQSAPVDVPAIIEPPGVYHPATPNNKRLPGSSRVAHIFPNRPEASSPTIVSTPPTPDSPSHKRSTSTTPISPTADGPNSPRSEAHKRSTSASAAVGPSKLSSIAASPLSPTAEDGGPDPGSGTGTGFFSSMFSAAQSAATNLSTNIQNSGLGIVGNKPRPAPGKQPQNPETPDPSGQDPQPVAALSPLMDHKDSTMRTIGSGDLSLSQLGIDETSSPIGSPSTAKFADADTRARSESAPVDTQLSGEETLNEEPSSRPRSFSEAQDGELSPIGAEFDDKGLGRSASVRTASQAYHRRGNSNGIGGSTVALGVPPTGNGLNTSNSNFSTPKLTGFAIASKKRNRDFHAIFKSVPDNDYLIEDYSCALQREILAHGRLYVSEGHLCFSSNILGWTTTLVMSFDEIVSMEKRSTALLFKNGLMISTLHSKHVFASFTSRDATYDLIVNIWKLGHPTLTSTLNGVRLEGTGGDKTEKEESAKPSQLETEPQEESDSEESSDDEGDEFYDEEEHEEAPINAPAEPSGEAEVERAVTRKASAMTTGTVVTTAPQGKDGASPNGPADFPGPLTHAPTECGDAGTHYDRVVGDDVIQAPLGQVYGIIFGQASTTWMVKFLTENQKGTELQFEDKKGLSLDNKSRTYTFIKPLYGSIGPKQTRCTITETVDNLDYEKAVNLSVSTQTPDVPSGNVFAVKTKYCLSWAENNATRVQINCTIEWSGKSWLKGPIEKGANDGQIQYCKELFAAIRSSISSRGRSGTGSNGATAKSKKKSKKNKINQLASESTEKGSVPQPDTKQSWGALEPIRVVVEPLSDIIKPLLTGNVMYGLLVGLLVSSWFGFGFTPGRNHPGNGIGLDGPDRLIAYEEIWRREDSELWDWLEERVGLERLNDAGGNPRKRATQPRVFEQKMKEDRMDAREVEEAMRVTEEKLRILQEAVDRANQAPIKSS
ncbi:unnamed protein product [Clonostachys rosea]|uniref:VASt domain-containing protein n=1 Tax=Bionectria ochroleuca TaxID=29856 RepID=A0ABY6TT36_BIOOC|nr:unnamed protein product [Clonostachys rosea]